MDIPVGYSNGELTDTTSSSLRPRPPSLTQVTCALCVCIAHAVDKRKEPGWISRLNWIDSEFIRMVLRSQLGYFIPRWASVFPFCELSNIFRSQNPCELDIDCWHHGCNAAGNVPPCTFSSLVLSRFSAGRQKYTRFICDPTEAWDYVFFSSLLLSLADNRCPPGFLLIQSSYTFYFYLLV